MKKPVEAVEWLRRVGLRSESGLNIFAFLDSLPDEFEIVPEGHVCVKWPEEVTKEWLVDQAELCRRDDDQSRPAKLAALAAIAPEKKKIRMVAWKNDILGYSPVLKPVNWGPEQDGWRKVGECEVDE